MRNSFGTRDGIRSGGVLPRRTPWACSADMYRNMLETIRRNYQIGRRTTISAVKDGEYTPRSGTTHVSNYISLRRLCPVMMGDGIRRVAPQHRHP